MRIERIELYDLALPLAEPFVIAGGAVTVRRSLVVVLYDDAGHVGYGESPPFELPFYSEETHGSAAGVLRDVLLPRLGGRVFDSPSAVDRVLRDNVRGNAFARAGAETAAWDLEAHRRGTGLATLVAERLNVAGEASVACGVALGIPPELAPDALTRAVYDAVRAGYRRVKLKVRPGWSGAAVAAARRGLAGADVPLTVDANGAYRWPEHERELRELDDGGLVFIEQPLAPEELVGHARLADVLRTPLCLDETLTGEAVARQVVALGGPLVWNLKVHRMGGLTETCRVCRVGQAADARLWVGTMPESGIGSQAALAVAALPLCAYPSDLEPSARWYGRGADVIKLVMGPDGRMAVPAQSAGRLLDLGRFRSVTRRVL